MGILQQTSTQAIQAILPYVSHSSMKDTLAHEERFPTNIRAANITILPKRTHTLNPLITVAIRLVSLFMLPYLPM